MDITEMTKEELRDYMNGNGSLLRFNSDSYEWKRAFKLARANGLEHVEMDCAKCIDKVKEWLLR